jgi:hypothetical protein
MKYLKHGIFVLFISLVALWISQIVSYHWHASVISERTFHVLWSVIYPSFLLGWIPKLLTFFLVGMLITGIVRTKYDYLWAIASGLIASMGFFLLRSPGIVHGATWIDWVYFNGDYLLYPLAAVGGSLAQTTITKYGGISGKKRELPSHKLK